MAWVAQNLIADDHIVRDCPEFVGTDRDDLLGQDLPQVVPVARGCPLCALVAIRFIRADDDARHLLDVC